MSEVVLTVSNTTPLLAGWYNPNRVDPQGLRTTEIKGVWRWWARAVIGGSLYDTCMFIGESGDDIVRKPSRDEARLINCLIGRILGLGYAGLEGSESSRFTLMVEPVTPPRIFSVRRSNIGRDYQRLALLTLDRDVDYVHPGAEFRITVRRIRTRYADAENLALKILILALQLEGLGKGARRGLGSLDIRRIQTIGVSVPEKLRDLINDIYENALDIVRRYSSDCGKRTAESCDKRSLPPIPVISRSSYQEGNVTSIYVVEGVTDLGRFQDIHNFFVRTRRCRVLHGSPICNDELRNRLQAWILGLPRSQRGTGYILSEGRRGRVVDRRASPIIVSYHSERNLLGAGVFTTFTTSGDWPRELEWVGDGSQNLVLDEQSIVNAMRTAFQEFNDYIERLGYRMVRVWP
jgi:CRISPR-associated protein Cmr1